MDIVIIGSGNAATVLGTKLFHAGHKILQVISRRQEHAVHLAEELHAGWSIDMGAINREAELYLVALSDDALYGLGERLSLPGKLVVHTAGTVAKEVLAKVSGRNGVFYPLQSLRKEIRPFPEIPLLVDADQPEDRVFLMDLAFTISANVRQVGDEERLKLHLAAIMVSNFTNYLYTMAAGFCGGEKVDFSMLLPLIKETAGRLTDFAPRDVQTGPAVRGDQRTIQKHLDLLGNYPEMTEFYKLFTNKIEAFYHPPEIPR